LDDGYILQAKRRLLQAGHVQKSAAAGFVMNASISCPPRSLGLHAEMECIASGSLGIDNHSSDRTSDIEMTSWNKEVLEQLMQMGIDVPIAQEASRRFSDIERAVNWAFDHGQTVSF
jgi:hypothetical protein